MFPTNIEFFGHERDTERLREAEHIRFVKAAGISLWAEGQALLKAASRLGARLAQWNVKRQGDIVTGQLSPEIVDLPGRP